MRQLSMIGIFSVLVLALGIFAWSRPNAHAQTRAAASAGIPKLLDLGAKTCIPCRLMAPLLDELTKDYAGKLDVEFVDVSEKGNVARAKQYAISAIPTQVFLDPAGKELWRHEGYIGKEEILIKFRELGYDLPRAPGTPAPVEQLSPARPDPRKKDQICYMCDGDLNARTLVTLATAKGDVHLCSPHCFFILESCLTEDKTGLDQKVSVTDFSTGKPIPTAAATFLHGVAEKTARPTVKAFADPASAKTERSAAGGNLLDFAALRAKELATRCGFCDRACYPEDAAVVKIEGVYSWGCCSHCALGVAARTGRDIEVIQPDALSGSPITVKTLAGSVRSIDPPTAVAWFGQHKNADGKWSSAGCFHQGFFTSQDSLKKWLEAHPHETGRQISIHQALADKMKLSPQQIQKACKIGECSPK